ncbi:MAG: bile acid:sodium symporter [Verrucomicrobia bacterium]|nr:bile acid:sodium symporter [Verrucomicrobiota bacterium]
MPVKLSACLSGTPAGLHASVLIFRTISSAIIVLIVFNAFAQLHADGSWQSLTPLTLSVLLLLATITILANHWIVWHGSKRWVEATSDRIAVLFCGSQKSLATGAPMAVVIFMQSASADSNTHLGLLLLPLLMVHPLQLLLAAVISPRLNQNFS